MKLILFILATTGLSYIVTAGDLFKEIREWITKITEKQKAWFNPLRYLLLFIDKVINCALCFGFWAGILLFLLMEYFKHYEIIFYAFAGSISSYIVYLIIKKLKL